MFFSSRSKTLNSYSGGIFVGFNVGFLITPHLTSNHDHEPCANWFEIRYIPRSGSCKTKSYLFITSNERSPSAICLIACRRPREKKPRQWPRFCLTWFQHYSLRFAHTVFTNRSGYSRMCRKSSPELLCANNYVFLHENRRQILKHTQNIVY